MSDRPACDALAEIAPELALGIATGSERARALEHLAGCPDCRGRLDELSGVADALLLLAPAREPPVGFETRVLRRLPAGARGRRWLARRNRRPRASRRGPATAAAMLLVAVLSAAAAGGGVLLATRQDRDLASGYSAALATADGRYFAAWNLYEHERGSRRGRGVVGTVFGYAGSPSWLFLTLRPPAGQGSYTCTIVLDDGRRVGLGTFTLRDDGPGWGRTIDVDLQRVARLELERAGGADDGKVFVAVLRQP